MTRRLEREKVKREMEIDRLKIDYLEKIRKENEINLKRIAELEMEKGSLVMERVRMQEQKMMEMEELYGRQRDVVTEHSRAIEELRNMMNILARDTMLKTTNTVNNDATGEESGMELEENQDVRRNDTRDISNIRQQNTSVDMIRKGKM